MTDDAYKITVKTDYEFDTGLISQTVDGPGFGYDLRSQIVQRVISTQDAQVRHALITLGWTPPPERGSGSDMTPRYCECDCASYCPNGRAGIASRCVIMLKVDKPSRAAPRNHKETDPMESMTFGGALALLKGGWKVARTGWNGKGMFVYLVPAASYPAQTGAAKSHFGAEAMVPYRAYLALKTADGDVATWAPSCSDVLADDWTVVE